MTSCRFRIGIVLLFFQQLVIAQNLAPNPSFEVYTTCPTNYSIGGPLEATPWTSGNGASPDYYNACCVGLCPVGVPFNGPGFQEAHTGEAYAGLYARIPMNWREYLQAPLLAPLEAGATYYVQFYVSPTEYYCTTKPFGALFTIGPPPFSGLQRIDAVAQVQVNGDFIDDFEAWTLVSGCFVAEGGEDYITIGNFLTDADTPTNPTCTIPPPVGERSYYYVDDVLVEKQPDESLEIELGDPVFACDSFVIDPGIPNVQYHWYDGSTDPTHSVYESGIYAVTISIGCVFGEDSLEVIIPHSAPVTLPDDEVSLCYPEVYSIELDPDEGNYTWSNGATGASIDITETGVYQVTLDDGCNQSTDVVNVDIIHAPDPFSLGDNLVLCPNEEITFSFDPDIGTYTWQNGQHTSDFTIIDEGQYSLTINNACGEESADVEVTLEDFPEIDLGNDQQYVCNNQAITFDFDPDAGDYVWQDGSENSEYTITLPGQYSVTLTNACGIVEDEIDVDVATIPVPNLGPDQLICEGQSVTLHAVNNGSIIWQDQSTDSTLVVNTPGTYAVTVTNACGTGIDSVEVGFYPALTSLDLGIDLGLCPGDTVVLNTNITNANYLWQDGSTADSLLIDTAGTYSVVVSNQCTSVTDTVTVLSQNEPPDIDLPTALQLCQGDELTIEAGIISVAYQWSDGSLADTLLITVPGTYVLTVTNACGSDVDSVSVLDGGPLPAVSLGQDIEFCPGEVVIVSANVQNVDSWLWQDGSTDSTFIISAPGAIAVQVSNSCGSANDTLIATELLATPIFDLGVDTSFCPGETVVLNLLSSGFPITWSDGTVDDQLIVYNAGSYYATLTGDCGVTSDTIEITELDPAPTLELGSDQSLCPGETILLDPGIDNVQYLWQDGSVGSSFTATVQGEIILIISNACGSATDTLNIVESTEGPVIDLGPDIASCKGDTIVLHAGIHGVDYLWQDGSQMESIEVTTTGQYILEVSNNCGLTRDTLNVDLSADIPNPDLGQDSVLCDGEKLVLYSHADPGTIIEWQDQSNGTLFEVGSPGTFILKESNQCGSAADSVMIDYLSPPGLVDLGPDTILCPGESILLSVPITANTITWQDGSHGNTLLATAGQLYTLEISNRCGIVGDEIKVGADTRVPSIDLEENYVLCPGEVITLDAQQTFEAIYSWSTGSATSSLQIYQPGEYALTIMAPCEQVSESVVVLEDEDCGNADIYFPNIFSPNDDGINDVFTVFFPSKLEIISLDGSIFDRWGNLIYHQSGLTFTWDGRFNDQPMMAGVYVFRVEMTYVEKGLTKEINKAGDVTLVK